MCFFVGPCEEENHFRCSNSRCVPSEVLCDGNNDCGDLSDEGVVCKSSKFLCYRVILKIGV